LGYDLAKISSRAAKSVPNELNRQVFPVIWCGYRVSASSKPVDGDPVWAYGEFDPTEMARFHVSVDRDSDAVHLEPYEKPRSPEIALPDSSLRPSDRSSIMLNQMAWLDFAFSQFCLSKTG
jgi:hypothetical protein